jgi:hypothetical protein
LTGPDLSSMLGPHYIRVDFVFWPPVRTAGTALGSGAYGVEGCSRCAKFCAYRVCCAPRATGAYVRLHASAESMRAGTPHVWAPVRSELRRSTSTASMQSMSAITSVSQEDGRTGTMSRDYLLAIADTD